jgi:hypothetical protein
MRAGAHPREPVDRPPAGKFPTQSPHFSDLDHYWSYLWQSDVNGRERLFAEARALIHEQFGLPQDAIGRGEADRLFADLKYRVLRKIDDDQLAAIGDPDSSEANADAAEDVAGALVKVHLPEERQRIRDLLQVFPGGRETKIEKLLAALGTLWRRNPREKASDDKTARLWDAATGTEIAVLVGHEEGVISAVFSPDGSRIVTVSGDTTAGIWDAATAKEIAVLRGHEGSGEQGLFDVAYQLATPTQNLKKHGKSADN